MQVVSPYVLNVVCAGPAVGIPATNTASCLRMLQSSLADVKNIVDGIRPHYNHHTCMCNYCSACMLELSDRYSTKIGHEYQLPTVSQVSL